MNFKNYYKKIFISIAFFFLVIGIFINLHNLAFAEGSVPSGKFVTPSADLYDEGITRQTEFRSALIAITNFALGFVGLLAVIALVYGGFLYITARGEEEQAKKGQKSATYAIIGILLILISFALVNTIIKFSGESDTSSAGGGSSIAGPNSNVNLTTGESIIITSPKGKNFESAFITTLEDAKKNGLNFSTNLIDGETLWDLGDGIIQKSNTVTAYKYGKSGKYNIQLVYKGSNGGTTTISKKVYIEPINPVVKITGNPFVNEPLTFDASKSTTLVGYINNYVWDFGDGNKTQNTEGATISHIFNTPGNYAVTLTLTDNFGLSSIKTQQVNIVEKDNYASFKWEVKDISHPNLISFDASDSKNFDGTKNNLTYEWNFGDGEFGNGVTIEHTFAKKGSYNVELILTYTVEGKTSNTSKTEIVKVDSALSFDLIMPRVKVNQPAIFTGSSSEKGGDYYFEFGDSENATQVDEDGNGFVEIEHTYKKSGKYRLQAEISNKEGETTKAQSIVYAINSDIPTAFIDISNADQSGATLDLFTADITKNIKFSAANSVNINGDKKNLKYSWDFGDGVFNSSQNSVHAYKTIGTYTVTLTVADSESQLADSTSVTINIKNLKPTLKNLTVAPQGKSEADGYTSPASIKLVAEGAKDPDGSIVSYNWYLSRNVGSSWEAAAVTTINNTNIVVSNKSGENQNVIFKVILKDNNGLIFDSYTDGNITGTEINIKSGKNQAPKASFSVDRTAIKEGETIKFTSASSDPDGDRLNYVWDFGDGKIDNTGGANIEHIYNKAGKFTVKLTVDDEILSSEYSLKINVEKAPSLPPVAAFTYTINGLTVTLNASNSKAADGNSIESYEWDLNTNQDSNISGYSVNGDGIKDNDVDDTGENTTATYDKAGNYQIKLTVIDNNGVKNSVKRVVNVK